MLAVEVYIQRVKLLKTAPTPPSQKHMYTLGNTGTQHTFTHNTRSLPRMYIILVWSLGNCIILMSMSWLQCYTTLTKCHHWGKLGKVSRKSMYYSEASCESILCSEIEHKGH